MRRPRGRNRDRGDPGAGARRRRARNGQDEPASAAPTVEAAIADGAPPVWPGRPDNVCFEHELGDRAQTAAAFANAAHVTRLRVLNQRVAGNPLEPRGCIGAFDRDEARWRLITSTANPHRIRQLAEHVLKVPAHRIHVVARDVGGGFGTKGGLYPEEVAVLWAARRIGRPVKWIADRSESFLADFNGRDQLADAAMAFDADGKILGVPRDDPPQPRLPGRAVGRASAADRRADAVGRVRDPGDARDRARRADAFADADDLPRRRPAGSDLSRRARARPGRARARHRSGRLAPAQSHRDHAVQDRSGRDLRLRRVRDDPRHRAHARRLGRLCRAAGGDRGTRPAARPRARALHRGVRDGLRPDGDPLRSDRRRDRRGGHLLVRPGPRDDVRADARTTGSACRSSGSA